MYQAQTEREKRKRFVCICKVSGKHCQFLDEASTNLSYVIDLTTGDRSRARAKRFKKHHKPSLTQSDCSQTSPHLDQLASEHATISSIGEELPSGSRGREVTGSSADSKRLSEFISSKEQSESNKEGNSLRSSQKLSLPEVTGVCSSVGLSAIANYIEDVESGESGGSVESGESDVDAEGESDWGDSGHEEREEGGKDGGCSGGESEGAPTHAREGKLEIPAVIQGWLNVQ